MAPKRQPPARPEPESEEDEEITEEEDFDGDDEEEEELDLTEVMNEMPLDVRRRVYSLKGYAKEFNDLMGKFREEVATLELQLLAKRKPFFEERRKIITGDRDVTAEEVSASKKVAEAASKVEEIQSSEEEDAKKGPRKGVKIVAPKDKPTEEEKGVPGFWMYALKHNEVLRHMISDRDEEVLKFLEDISIDYVDNKPTKGFVLTFHFLDNPFFSNNTLTKTCLWEQEREGDEETIDKLTGCTIDWKAPSQNVTVTIKEKKQRHKSGKGVRVVKHEEKAPSFFHFFSPLQLNDEGEVIGKVEEDEDPQELVEIDEDMTLAIANNVIPRATFYYTGEALAKLAQQLTMELQGDGLEEGEEEEEDEEEESEEEEKPAPPRGRGGKAPGGRGAAPGGRGRGAAPPADCKTQ